MIAAPAARFALPDADHVHVEAVLFDMDGLLLDSERIYREVFIAAALLQGCDIAARYNDFIGRSNADCYALLREWHPGVDYAAISAEARRLWDERCPGDEVPLKDGAHVALDRLDVLGLPRAVATSTAGHRARAKLAASGLLPRFAAVVGGDEVRAAKPAPDIYLEAARRIGADPQRCLALEDSVIGFTAARAAGCITVMIPDLLAPPNAEWPVLDSLHTVAARLAPHS
jgi:beta-phosphoglucomutase-like phosphatase (HAD superfamily)